MQTAERPASVETLHWRDVPGPDLPDSDLTVMCELTGDSEPAWPGYWTGEAWLNIEGLPFAGTVTGWADMPAGRLAGNASGKPTDAAGGRSA